ncbi:hypothetical protein QN277_006084 [Acacia crassicarpa]|uniref:Cysteine-rich receptor-like protein kinase n=1 Tax=Acacia crassicarpa TaxID=499986 RepID=A0AAE1JUV4_9FABA|nr:hypothetical protein QN277_006084 [Acacia crassicarpa]
MTTMVMASHRAFFLLFSFLLRFLFSESQTTFLFNACSSTKTFTANSSFQSDLTTLLSSLSSANTDFYNTTVAAGGGGEDTIYGLFMCRGDVTLQVCRQCVGTAVQRVPSMCGFSKEAIIWYDECLLRYSNRSFFSTVDTSPQTGFPLWNTGNVSGQANFKSIMFTTMNKTADEAAAAKHGLGEKMKKYATKEANISGSHQTLYSLAQCTPDLSPGDCRKCLDGAIGRLSSCCEGMAGGRVLCPSCNVRYEVFRFYRSDDQLVGTPTSILPSPPTLSSDPRVKGKGKSAPIIVIVVVCIVGTAIVFGFAYYLLKHRMKKSRRAVLRQKYFGSEGTSLEPLEFNLATIESATNKFSEESRLGKGGFGQVYKGILSNGQNIAVKRLSKGSGQGAEEFKNEVLFIARLQHINLVTLLGFCIEGQEKILVYEYVPNRSLDYFLFGSGKSKVLNWLERCKIIGGVARGILYLHDHSRLKIIHRDLKPSNILLDDEMNPKISDFGLAKMVAISENEGKTNRIAGTYGYMSPEYAMFGKYSEKSDVFSFGIITLQIISGRKNTNCHEQSKDAYSLISYVWNQWRDEKFLEILDPNLKEFGSYNEVTKCIQIGLLCVQKNPDLRPSMAKVVHYLTNDSIQLPFPQEPAFLLLGPMEPSTSGSASNESYSINEVSVSEFLPR